jgi:magnesium chelatase family protein
VANARSLSIDRGVRCNAELPAHRLDEVAPLSAEAAGALRAELERGSLTGRGLRRVRTVARTIADLQQQGPTIDLETVQAALALRSTPRSVLGVAA